MTTLIHKIQYRFRSTIVLMLLCFPIIGVACTCSNFDPQERLASAQLFMVGTVARIDEEKKIAYFDIEKVYKGSVAENPLPVYSSDFYDKEPKTSCDMKLKIGESYALLSNTGSWPDGKSGYTVYACSIFLNRPYHSSLIKLMQALPDHAK